VEFRTAIPTLAFLALCALAARIASAPVNVHVDLALWEAILVLQPGFIDYAMNKSQPERDGNRDRRIPPYSFKAKGDDDKWVTVERN
jgi:crotonobetainyl-CoA:carnitine CoA-transferase CaiB-like acyl-CoA transferase